MKMDGDRTLVPAAAGTWRHWRLEHDAERLAWLTFDKQGESANTLSSEALEEFRDVLRTLAKSPPAGMVVLSGKDSGFIAGADVGEFTRIANPQEAHALVRRGWDAFNELAAVPWPTLALIRGFCMGGGLELALACRYRVVVDEPGTRLALPEVMLGIVPGWGGMRRLPKTVGAPAALDMMLTGRGIDAKRAKRMGLADECVPPRIMFHTARGVLRALPPRRALPRAQRIMLWPPLRGPIAGQARKKVAARARREHYPAPYAILEMWARHDGDPFGFPDGHPSSLSALLASPTTRNLIRVFGLQDRLKGLAKESAFKARHVHVVGAGTMGGDIAAWCALRGLTVTLQDQDAKRLAPAMARAGRLFRERIRDERLRMLAHDRLAPDVAGDGARRADLIIEAIFENLEAKQKLFAELESRARPEAVLATNTSSIPLERIAEAMRDPTRLVGLHFFNPVAKMMLVEVVVGRDTRPDLVSAGASFARQIDRLPLPVKSAPGFLVNRILAPYLMAAMQCVDEGIAPETVDEAALAFGMPMGPIELADTVGLDICVAVGKLLAGGGAKPPAKLEALVAKGELGRKSGRGFYDWSSGKAAKGSAGSPPAGLADRLVAPMVAEAQACLREGIVADGDLLDAGAIFGTGFAPFRGGPIHFAEESGAG